jgi:glycosyltransferase involved in cell wall biosynthesis
VVCQFNSGRSGPGCAHVQQQDESVAQSTGRTIVNISVAMCTYNGSKFLAEQLKSIEEQAMLPCELIICDDGSTDSTPEIVRVFAAGAPFPVNFLRNEVTLGSTRNFEKAVCLCSGNAIALCDQDDVWHKDKLSSVAEAFDREPGVGGVFSDALLVDENSERLPESLFEKKRFTSRQQATINDRNAAPLMLLEKNPITGATFVFRSEFVQDVTPIPSEWVHDAWIALLIATQAQLRALPARLMSYRLHPGQQIGIRPPRVERQRAIASWDTLIKRLEAFTAKSAGLPLDPAVARLAQERLGFLRARTALRQQGAVSRLLGATCQLPEYFRFSKGLLSYCRDVIRS